MPPTLLYGFLIGLSQLIATLVVFAMGLHASAATLERAQFIESLTGFILLMIVISLAHRAAKEAGRTATVGAAAKGAALTGLLGGLATGAGQYVYFAFINPGLQVIQRNIILEGAKAELAKLDATALADAHRHIDYATSPLARGIIYTVNTTLFAILLGIAFALIFRAAAKRDEAAGKKK